VFRLENQNDMLQSIYTVFFTGRIFENQ
jgi:hypothetical protein